MGKAMQVGAADSVCDFVPHYLRPYQEEGWLAAWQSGLRMLAGVKHWKPLAPVMMPGGRTADGEYQAVKFFSPEVVKA